MDGTAATPRIELPRMACDVCDGSDAYGAVVMACGIGPASFCYCIGCAVRRAEPTFAFEYLFEEVGTEVAEHVKGMSTYVDGRYVSWSDWAGAKAA